MTVGTSLEQCRTIEFYLMKSVSKFGLIIGTDSAEYFLTSEVIKSTRLLVELSPTKISVLGITRHALSLKCSCVFI